MMRIAYFGSSESSAFLVQRIFDNRRNLDIDLRYIITQPDRPVGRKMVITATPVKVWAEKNKIPCITGEYIDTMKQEQIDICILYSFGGLIPPDALDTPRYGFWNIHPSLLPRYRGTSPIAYPIMNGDERTGVTLMQMDSELDHGHIIAQTEITIDPHLKRPDLEQALTEKGWSLLKLNLKSLTENGAIESTAQDESKATYTKKLKREDGFVIWESLRGQLNLPKEELILDTKQYNLYRALYPWPGVWTEIELEGQKRRLKLIEVNPEHVVTKAQLDGKTVVEWKQFFEAYGQSFK